MNGKQARKIRKSFGYNIAADRSSAEYKDAKGEPVKRPYFYITPKTFFRNSHEADLYKRLKRAFTATSTSV